MASDYRTSKTEGISSRRGTAGQGPWDSGFTAADGCRVSRYAGTYDQEYVKSRHPLPPVDFSYRFFNGAHPDLQVEGYLNGDEDVVLLNVCPDTPDMRFRLPGIVPRVTVARWDRPPDVGLAEFLEVHASAGTEPPLTYEPIATVLDTLVFVPDEGVFYEVFRGMCRLSSLDSLEIARITVTA